MADEIPDFDLYAELEVSERASVETIQAAYRSLQLRNHPDRAGAEAGDRAVRLNIARDWLTDPARRAEYDGRVARRRLEAERTRDAPEPPVDVAGDAASGREDDAETAEGIAGDATDAPAGGLGLLHLVRHHLRLDTRRLGRVWIVGLAVIGALAIVPGLVAPPWLRIAVALAGVLLLLVLALGRTGADETTGMASMLARWVGMLVGWVVLAVLAVEGVWALIALVGGQPTPAGLVDVAGPALAVAAVLSVFAIRRRHAPIETSVDDFLEMTPREFETAVGRVLGGHGYRLRLTGGPGDLAADLTGTDPAGRPTVVQCKRYAPGHPVGSRDVQLLIAMGVRHHGAERLVLVTTSDFTDPAVDLADEHGVTLISGEELEDLAR